MKKEAPCYQQLELALTIEEDASNDDSMVTEAATTTCEVPEDTEADQEVRIQDPRLWYDDGWTARIVRNESDEGWAVEMIQDGEPEPALVSPWTMGRDKKSPKPLDAGSFAALVKTASEVLRRHHQQLHAMLHKSVTVMAGAEAVTVTLDIVPQDENAYAVLAAHDEAGAKLGEARVAPTFKLNKASALAWVERGFRQPK